MVSEAPFWRQFSTWLVAALGSIGMLWLGCQQLAQSQIQERQEQQTERMRDLDHALKKQERDLDRAEARVRKSAERLDNLKNYVTDESHRTDVRMVRIEMKLDQLLLGTNVRQPRGLPDIPDPSSIEEESR